jgi:hypothetical protein
VPPALATLFGLHETGDCVFRPREVHHMGDRSIETADSGTTERTAINPRETLLRVKGWL